MGGFGVEMGLIDCWVQWEVPGHPTCRMIALVVEAFGGKGLPQSLGPTYCAVQLRISVGSHLHLCFQNCRIYIKYMNIMKYSISGL